MGVTWMGVPARAAIVKELQYNVEDAAILLQGRVQDLIAVQGPPRSAPGEPPHVDTKALHDSIDYDVNTATLTAYVGSELPYAAALEYGRRDGSIAARPWLSRACIENADDVARELGK